MLFLSLITTCNPKMPDNAAADITLKSPPSVTVDVQADKSPDSKSSLKITSGGNVAVGVGVWVGVCVAVGVTPGADVAVGVGVRVAVDVNVRVGVGEAVGAPPARRRDSNLSM